jgi:hypothetical protein
LGTAPRAKSSSAYTVYLGRALKAMRAIGEIIPDALLSHIAPLGRQHVNLTGDYLWRTENNLALDSFRPLRGGDRLKPGGDMDRTARQCRPNRRGRAPAAARFARGPCRHTRSIHHVPPLQPAPLVGRNPTRPYHPQV